MAEPRPLFPQKRCPRCGRTVAVMSDGRLRVHVVQRARQFVSGRKISGQRCAGSRQEGEPLPSGGAEK